MDQNTQNNVKNVAIATTVGLLAGTVIGILIAPRSGRETREMIKQKTQKSVEDMQAKIAEIRNKLAHKIEDLREISVELVGEAKTESQELIRRAEILKEDLKAVAIEFSESAGEAREAAGERMQMLASESKDVMHELSRTTRQLSRSAKAKLSPEDK